MAKAEFGLFLLASLVFYNTADRILYENKDLMGLIVVIVFMYVGFEIQNLK